MEIENILLRPDFSSKLSQAIVGSLGVVIDRQVKEAVSQVVVPEVMAMKNEMSRWQSETNRNNEVISLR